MFLKSTLVFLLFTLSSFMFSGEGFKEEQMKNDRVKTAFKEKEKDLIAEFKAKKMPFRNCDLFIRIFKNESSLELWASKKGENRYELMKYYKICTESGRLGPKRVAGDMQIPEGFYYIDTFNPTSPHFLGLGINYPNDSDKILGNQSKLGSDVYIEGNCISESTIPLTDEKIKELYIACVQARDGGQEKISVHIFPTKMDENGMNRLRREYAQFVKTMTFFENIRPGFEYFESKHSIPNKIKVNSEGGYIFK
jgi:murein L,D-transpeptidase YafK